MPIVIPTQKEKEEIEQFVSLIKKGKRPKIVHDLNKKVFDLYGLSKEEKDYILGKHRKTINSIFTLKNNTLFNYANI